MPQVWELVFMMLILKIPIVYLCWVVYWAVKSEPKPPLEPALATVRAPGNPRLRPPKPGRRSPRRPRGGPHGAPCRTYARRAPEPVRAVAR
jgi:hypothetical protein